MIKWLLRLVFKPKHVFVTCSECLWQIRGDSKSDALLGLSIHGRESHPQLSLIEYKARYAN